MKSYSYAEIEKDLPLIVKAELQRQDDTQRQIFADDFGKKRRTLFHGYGFAVLFYAHRWYLGKPWMTVALWVLILCYGIGFIWLLVDLFLLPGMIRERNAEIAKSILAEYRMMNSSYAGYNMGVPMHPQPMTINVSNTQSSAGETAK